MIKAVVFDLDGTLADTLESLAYCTNRALADFGLPAQDKEKFKRFVGNGARMQITRALRCAGDSEIETEDTEADDDGFLTRPQHLEPVLKRYLEYFEKDCMYQVVPYEGICGLLETLSKRQIKLGVFSNKPHENTVSVIDTLFEKGYFSFIQGQTSAIRKKPFPDGLFLLMEQLGVEKSQLLYVGDSCVDMDTGKAAGVKTIGVLWGFREREELLAHGADGLIAKPDQLLEYLEPSGKSDRNGEDKTGRIQHD